MPLPQVNDRLKEIPAQALRTVFATIGQLLLVADRLRARAASQLSGTGEATATRPADQAPAAAPPPPPPPAKPPTPAEPRTPDAASSRWRSLDKTGNVRLLDGNEAQDDEELTGAAEPFPGAAGYTPTEVVPAVSDPAEPAPDEPAAPEAPAEPALPEAPLEAELPPAPAEAALPPAPAEPALPEPALAAPALAEPALAEPALPEAPLEAELPPAPAEAALPPAPAEPAPPAAAEPALSPPGADLPVPSYDQLSVASLRARLRVLDAARSRRCSTTRRPTRAARP